MEHNIRRTLLSAAALVLIVSPGLSSCSKTGQENATEQAANEPAATEQTPAGSAGGGQDASSQNARALLKGMSDYLAAQKVISLSYDSIFEVVSEDHQKLQLATSGT